MIIGIPKEIKDHEYRVGATPGTVGELTSRGHTVLIEHNAGAGINFSDKDYQQAGATIANNADIVFEKAELIIKVKEPQPEECLKLRPNQVLFTFLHLAAEKKLTQALLDSGCIAYAYETVTDNKGSLPLLAPMSEVAGRFSVQAGAQMLEKSKGGRGILLGGVPGVMPGQVTIIGGGMVGVNALRIAVGMGAQVSVLDLNANTLRSLDAQFGNSINTVYATKDALERCLIHSDLVIGAVLLPGGAAPKLITKAHLQKMRQGAVFVDVAIDQGGCAETSRPTTHSEPTFVEEGVIHYCVTNIPGGVPRTSTFALNNATLPFIVELADKGYKQASLDNIHLRNGLNIHKGKLTYKAVADAFSMPYQPIESLLT